MTEEVAAFFIFEGFAESQEWVLGSSPRMTAFVVHRGSPRNPCPPSRCSTRSSASAIPGWKTARTIRPGRGSTGKRSSRRTTRSTHSGICRRIRVLERALQDLEGQAMRLARWRARRDRETCKPKRFSPLRPGRPPGWRKRPKTAVEEVLKECHFLARDAWNTS